MKIRPLFLGPATEAAIKRVVDYAEQHRLNIHSVFAAFRQKLPVGDDPNRKVVIPVGYRCAFSIEQQPQGWCRHVSFSVESSNPEDMPSTQAVDALLPLFGFKAKLDCKNEELFIYLEDLPGGFKAINVVEKLEVQ